MAGDWIVGDDATQHAQHLNLTYPIENGVIQEWEAMQAVWRHSFQLLGLESGRGHKILLTEAPLNPKANREKMVRWMLEEFEFDAVHVAVQATLVLYSQGLTSGLVVDIGDGVTHMVPVVEGFCPEHLVQRIDLAGRDVSRQMQKLLQINGYYCDLEQVRLMKESLCYIAY